jgi:hypothetical protein
MCNRMLRYNISIYGSTSLCWALGCLSVYRSYTQSSGLLGRGISPSQGNYLYTEHHRHKINETIPCLQWNSNPPFQRSSERRRFMPQIARPLWSAYMYMAEENIWSWERWRIMSNIIRVIKTNEMCWAEDVARIGEMRILYQILAVKN